MSPCYSVAQLCLTVTPWTAAHQASLSITFSWSLLRLMSIESVMPSNHLVLCHPLLLLPSLFPSVRIFSNESPPYIRWPEYWSFSFSISPSTEYSGWISFRIDWFDLLAVQGTPRYCLLAKDVHKERETNYSKDCPGGPVAKTLTSSTESSGSIPGQRN